MFRINCSGLGPHTKKPRRVRQAFVVAKRFLIGAHEVNAGHVLCRRCAERHLPPQGRVVRREAELRAVVLDLLA